MQLKDFVSGMLCGIIDGVVDAQREVQKHDAYVNPGNTRNITNRTPDNQVLVTVPGKGALPRVQYVVEFDVAVVVTNDSTNKVGGGVLTVVSVGASNQTTAARETTSRVKFSVPIVYPLSPGLEPKKSRDQHRPNAPQALPESQTPAEPEQP